MYMVGLEEKEYVENIALVQEEKEGRAGTYLVKHSTSIDDPAVLDSIRRMSYLEIIS